MKGKEFYSMDISMGDIIKKMIRRKGMKQTDFAEKMGFGKSNISILLNKKDWYVSKVIQASEILEVNLFTYLVRQEDYTSNVFDEETPVWQMMKTEKQKQSLENDLIDCKENLRHMRNYNDELKTKIAALEAKK